MKLGVCDKLGWPEKLVEISLEFGHLSPSTVTFSGNCLFCLHVNDLWGVKLFCCVNLVIVIYG